MNTTEYPVWIIFHSTLVSDSPTELTVAYESRSNTPGLTRQLELSNWNTGQVDVVDSRDASFNVDSVVTVDISAAAGDYVEAGTGSVQARLGWKATGFLIVHPWQVSIDHFYWQATN